MKPKNVIQVSKRVRDPVENEDLTKSWRQVLGNPPRKDNIKDWIVFQKKKWSWQRKQKQGHQRNNKRQRMDDEEQGSGLVVRTGVNRGSTGTIGKNYSTAHSGKKVHFGRTMHCLPHQRLKSTFLEIFLSGGASKGTRPE